ncbi:MAG TPA: RluA family pseudouridine synthase [Chloroflexota bacterium]|nr:RluA family pseudouridine synthase [Chloroflexota bacterium]
MASPGAARPIYRSKSGVRRLRPPATPNIATSPVLWSPNRLKRFSTVVPEIGSSGRAQPVWRLGSVLKFCLGLSRVERSRIWRLGGASINGAPAGAPFLHCRPGDLVAAWYPEAESSVTPETELAGQLRVLYEDQWLLAIDKPAGMLSHPARSEQHGTAANAVAARYAGGGDVISPIRPVHRLDRDTSGVLLFAREARVAGSLARQRSAGTLGREYVALVTGRPPAEGEVTQPLAPDPTHRTRQLVSPDGREARTTYRVIQYGAGGTLIAARLHTGRTHQLRAHMTALGHPLLGDGLYGGPDAPPLARQALHAWRLRLRHPITHQPLTITAPLPPDLREAARAALL